MTFTPYYSNPNFPGGRCPSSMQGSQDAIRMAHVYDEPPTEQARYCLLCGAIDPPNVGPDGTVTHASAHCAPVDRRDEMVCSLLSNPELLGLLPGDTLAEKADSIVAFVNDIHNKLKVRG